MWKDVYCMTVYTVSLNSGGCDGLFARRAFRPCCRQAYILYLCDAVLYGNVRSGRY